MAERMKTSRTQPDRLLDPNKQDAQEFFLALEHDR
jgi:hypothetical protein